EWTGLYFVKSSLKDLGLRVQLNHLSMKCSKPEPSHSHFVVLHTNGIHEVAIDFCGCRPISKLRQLLRRGLFPSSQDNPRTCATFTLLKQLQMLSLTSKCATYDYYRMLERLTDNRGAEMPKSKYRSLLRMILQWRHLKMLKRAGRGHDPTGVNGTKEGELALACPSCPHPGINLPDNWRIVSDEEKFLYFVLLCIDANFRLKNQLVSNYSVDPGLGNGMSYTIERGGFEKYVKSRADDKDEEKKGCGLQAVDQANTKYSKGLRYTGVTAVSCGRSEMVTPCSVGNLVKGEKYAFSDYSMASTLRFYFAALFLVVSYDIVCRWFINFARRVKDHWPESLKPSPQTRFFPVIPKLHYKSHKKTKNHEQFSFNLCPGVGLSDGEGPERIWSAHNPLGNSTKTMGPGSRHDVLDDHFGFWNYEKYTGMGRVFLTIYTSFTASLKPEDVARWSKMCEDWEKDVFPKSAENPYHVQGTEITQEKARIELDEQEKQEKANGRNFLHEITPSLFLIKGLELEDSQTIQAIYMPGLLQHLQNQERVKPGSTTDSEKSEDMYLWLPSSLSKADRDIVCIAGLSASEEKLRTAQCHDTLSGVCDTLRLKSRMVDFKNKNVRGQRDGLRSREVINRIHNRARKFAAQYRAARVAKLSLTGPGPWEKSLRVLLDSDIRSPQDPERLKPHKRRRGTWEDSEKPSGMDVEEEEDNGEEINLFAERRTKRQGTGKTRLTISWIWTVIPYDEDSDDQKVADIMRAEWSESRARVRRAIEEVRLLREEMRRTLAYLDWKAGWWISRQTLKSVEDVVLMEGLKAYCFDQSAHQLALKDLFQGIWRRPLDVLIAEDDSDGKSDDSGGSDIDDKIDVDMDSDMDSDASEDTDSDDEQDNEKPGQTSEPYPEYHSDVEMYNVEDDFASSDY
ncbi:hypothetical protein GALMADRAFT_75522, partial [Galerina marginata CBS 339.88]